jgi:hypothetical protein
MTRLREFKGLGDSRVRDCRITAAMTDGASSRGDETATALAMASDGVGICEAKAREGRAQASAASSLRAIGRALCCKAFRIAPWGGTACRVNPRVDTPLLVFNLLSRPSALCMPGSGQVLWAIYPSLDFEALFCVDTLCSCNWDGAHCATVRNVVSLLVPGLSNFDGEGGLGLPRKAGFFSASRGDSSDIGGVSGAWKAEVAPCPRECYGMSCGKNFHISFTTEVCQEQPLENCTYH